MKLYKKICRFWIESPWCGSRGAHPATSWVDEEDADKIFKELKSQHECAVIKKETSFAFVKVEEN